MIYVAGRPLTSFLKCCMWLGRHLPYFWAHLTPHSSSPEIHVYIYILHNCWKNLVTSFENMAFTKKVIYLLRSYDCFVRNIVFQRKAIICFENKFVSFGINICFKKVNGLLRKYNLLFEDMICHKKVSYLLRRYGFTFKNMFYLKRNAPKIWFSW